MGPVKQRAALDDRAADGAQYKNEGVRLLRMVTAMDEADCVLATAMDQGRDSCTHLDQCFTTFTATKEARCRHGHVYLQIDFEAHGSGL